MSKPEFVYVTYIETTAENLWQALTSSDFVAIYWFGYRVDADWKVGSPYKFFKEGSKSVEGKVLEIRSSAPAFLYVDTMRSGISTRAPLSRHIRHRVARQRRQARRDPQ